MSKLGVIAFITVAFMYLLSSLSGCYVGPVDVPGGSFSCIPGEVIDPDHCDELGLCAPDTTHLVCNESGNGTACRTRPGAVCDLVPPGPCNGLPVGETCELCGEIGITACVGGVVRCVQDHAPSETCDDGIDNDCDGLVDEDCAACPEGDTRPCGTSVGACVAGTETCRSGAWSACEGSLGPTPETCNGQDDNCDGTTDEGCVCTNGATQSCGTNVGTCVSGTRICSGGSWGSCEGSLDPVSEICGDGRDNDCDGSTDEDCGECTPRNTQTCSTACGTAGMRTCGADRMWQPGAPPAETCNGIDDNCNGSIDETCACVHGRTRSCGSSVGECSTGTETCSGGAWGSCVGSVGPSTEVCGNGVDDDCDGSVDEGCAPVCSITNGGVEACDGVDNDCDGVIDEDASGNEFVGDEVCFTLGPDMAPIETYDHTRVVSADLTIFGCDGTRHTRTFVAGGPTQVCVPITAGCGGWLAATYSDSRTAFGPVGNIGTWYQPATAASCSIPAMSFHGMRADDPRLSGCETSASNVIVFGRRPGLANRHLEDRSWITYDPSGVTWPDGRRVDRLMIPVRAACAMSGAYPPDRY